MTRRFDASHDDFPTAFAAFLDEPRGAQADVLDAARSIVDDVAEHGFDAVLKYTSRYDRVDWTAETARVSGDEIATARQACDADDLAALNLAADRIRAVHERQLPQDGVHDDGSGVVVSWRWTPIDAVGIYVPGGLASYPSSVLMNAVPARVAGVPRVVMVVPAPDGVLNPLVLAAADLAGVDEIYKVGGAQAVAALAYGADPIPAVDKIVGPGNAYVAAAKRLVFGRVGIDAIAGPSEILVIADADNDPEWIAADVLSQAEHDPNAQSILIADDDGFIDAVLLAVGRQLGALPESSCAQASWSAHGAVIKVGDLAAEAPALANQIAAEHVELAIDEPDALARHIRHAGAIFLGRLAPEALGDYVTGSNHVLPTAGAARFSSGLSTSDFMKRTSIQSIDAAGLAAIGPAAERLARAEGLPAHANSVAQRLKPRDG